MANRHALVDADRLAGWLGVDADAVEITRITSGHSNLTFAVTAGGRELVLRRPPRGELAPTAHDVLREARVIAALGPTPVRVPAIVRTSAPDGDGVLPDGKPFFVMERVPGHVLRAGLPGAWGGPGDGGEAARRRAVSIELVDALAELHLVDWASPGVGLGDLGKADGYLARQLRRWTGQRDYARTRELGDLDAAGRWLADHLPESGPATLVHGDYKLDNVSFAPEAPPRINAIFDWEMATVGDPLADVGYLLTFWPEPGEPAEGLLGLSALSAEPGFASRAELLDRYAERTGRRIGDVRWYRVLAIWKLAILLEASYTRHLQGTADDPFFALLEAGVPQLAAAARELAEI